MPPRRMTLLPPENSLNVAVEAVDTSAGIRISETTRTLVDGADGVGDMLSAQYTVTLQAAPAGTVTVTVVRSDAADANGDVTVTPEFHTFSANNLSNIFSIALTDDLDTAAEASITISHTITSSDEAGDAAYTALSPEVLVTFDGPGCRRRHAHWARRRAHWASMKVAAGPTPWCWMRSPPPP